MGRPLGQSAEFTLGLMRYRLARVGSATFFIRRTSAADLGPRSSHHGGSTVRPTRLIVREEGDGAVIGHCRSPTQGRATGSWISVTLDRPATNRPQQLWVGTPRLRSRRSSMDAADGRGMLGSGRQLPGAYLPRRVYEEDHGRCVRKRKERGVRLNNMEPRRKSWLKQFDVRSCPSR